MSNNDHLPTSAYAPNNIDLDPASDSTIAGVSVYAGRAEVTRIFKLLLKPGQNFVKINSLPNDLEPDSVRVEGRGRATIHDVTVRTMPRSEPEIPAALSDLEERKQRIDWAVERHMKMGEAFEKYLSTLEVGRIPVDELDKILERYDTAGAKLGDKIIGLKKQQIAVENEIQEQEKAAGSNTGSEDRSWRLRTMILLSLFTEKESEIELVLIYAVRNASWTPIYDIRVDMHASEKPVTLVYRAAIKQNTAEDWENVPLTLESATPTFQVGILNLDTWTVSLDPPLLPPPPLPMIPSQLVPYLPHRAYRGSNIETRTTADEESYRHSLPPPPMRVLTTTISSKGNVSATFTVPGKITIPSDNAEHSVTVTQLHLDATMSWVAVPKLDSKARLSAKIKNASEYTLLSGIGSIYVDGSFIAKSDIPAVSPGESFICALGLDPAIRITYHPVSTKLSKTGFYTKHDVHSYSQRISVYNTKSITIKDLRITDQIPVSVDESITVKLLTPALPTVHSHTIKDERKGQQPALHPKVQVSEGVVVGWGDGTEDTATTEDGMVVTGQDGKLSWLCEIPPQGKVNLLLQWELTSRANAHVFNV